MTARTRKTLLKSFAECLQKTFGFETAEVT